MLRKLSFVLLLTLALTSTTAPAALAFDFPSAQNYMSVSGDDYWHDARVIADLMMSPNGLHIRFTNGDAITIGIDQGGLNFVGAATTAMIHGLPVQTYVSNGQVTAIYAQRP